MTALPEYLLPFQFVAQCSFHFSGISLNRNQTLAEVGILKCNTSTVVATWLIQDKWPLTLLIERMNESNITDPIHNAQKIVRGAVRLLRPHRDRKAGVLFHIDGAFKVCVIKTESETYQIPTQWRQGEFVLSEMDNAQRARLMFLQHLRYCPFNRTFT